MESSGSIARVRSAILAGVQATLVTVEVYRGPGLPQQTIVGLAGGAVRESLDRVHAACAHSGVALKPRKTTINLAPAGTRKSGSGLDLPIALGLLAADGVVPGEELEHTVALGELALDGDVRSVPGVLPAALAARSAGVARLLVPQPNAGEAAAVPGLEVRAVMRLREAIGFVRGQAELPVASAPEHGGCASSALVDLSEVRGQAVARRALEVAAAGGHHLLLSGPPGAGKTLLARALAGILPPMTFAEAIEASAVHSAVGGLLGRGLLSTRPFRAPHHSISPAGLVGGGNPLRPGEISLANRGVLFLDELPEFRRQALECLRQPLEEGEISLTRANESHTLPARFQLVAAMNECLCGRGPEDLGCGCSDLEVVRYQRRVSGPLTDRIDLFVRVQRLPLEELTSAGACGETSASVAARVVVAREAQHRRGASYGADALVNADLPASRVVSACGLHPNDLETARRMAERLDLSARAWYRMLRVARTCADLDGVDRVAEPHVLEALSFRRT